MTPTGRCRAGLGILLMIAAASATTALGGTGSLPAGATTTTGTLVGEGGAYLEPVTNKLLRDDVNGLAPDFGAYTNVVLDHGISDFVGTGPGEFAADYVVSERPLTSAEEATAEANGRKFAYVPFAASGVAVVTTAVNNVYQAGAGTIGPSDFCTHIPLDLTQLGEIFGTNTADPMQNWDDPRFDCTPGVPLGSGQKSTGSLWANLDPTTENLALMTLLDSDPTSETFFSDGLSAAFAAHQAVTSDDTPSENWPYVGGGVVPGGDQVLIGKMIGIGALSNAPSTNNSLWNLGVASPISSVWTGSPLGVRWNLPTAAIVNAAGQDVFPSAAAAAAAEADATLASTTNPTTNNLVTFNADASDDAAYNNYLMQESYLVVPTNGLSADKAVALAQFIRFVLGKTGQADITSFGAAPATTAMTTAGETVAQQLDAEAAASTSSAATTTTTSASATTTTSSVAGAGTTSTTVAGSSTTSGSTSSTGGSSGSGTSDGSGLAFTGSNVGPLVVIGFALVAVGELSRRAVRRRRARS